jgi:hypothetical protein
VLAVEYEPRLPQSALRANDTPLNEIVEGSIGTDDLDPGVARRPQCEGRADQVTAPAPPALLVEFPKGLVHRPADARELRRRTARSEN